MSVRFAAGKHETKNINVDGRLLFDVLTVTEREHKLSHWPEGMSRWETLGSSVDLDVL